MAEGAVGAFDPSAAAAAKARINQNRANQVMQMRNEALGTSNQPPIFQQSGCKAGSAPTSQVVPNDAQPQANVPQLNKQQQRMVEYYQTKITEAGQEAQKTGDYSGMKAIQQEANQACQQAGIPPEAMQ